jgi:hypothetical protein
VSDRIQPGTLFAPYHFSDLNASALLARGGNTIKATLAKA